MVRRDDAEFLDFAAAVRPQLRRTAYLICHDWDAAADITQEALIRPYVAWPRLEHSTGLRTYARRTLVRVALDGARKRSSQELPTARVPDRAGEDPATATVERLVLIDALATLPPRQRACVVLRHYDDLSVDDVAAALGCRAGTVKSQTARGLATLRETFRSRGEELVVDAQDPTEATTW
jgi:RNA polymerase sigma-70 factor (sigma-E family)